MKKTQALTHSNTHLTQNERVKAEEIYAKPFSLNVEWSFAFYAIFKPNNFYR